MSQPDFVRVATLSELRAHGVVTVRTGRQRVAVYADGADVWAVDNRCPHMGFPLDQGTVRDGILTCHWHQARFDLRSGCTFDLWADDVPRFETRIEGDDVYVAREPLHRRDATYHRRRLRLGMEQNIPLVQAKSLLNLLGSGVDLAGIAGEVTIYASANLNSWTEGMVRLTCVANLYPDLTPETAYQALLYAIRQVAAETSDSVPRREREPLDADDHPADALKGWLRQWVATRHRDGAERTVLTALRSLSHAELADLGFGAACERLYAEGGHLFDAWNKSFELIELLGWERAPELLPLLMQRLSAARGEEESTDWHHPIEIVEPLREAQRLLPELMHQAQGKTWAEPEDLVKTLLGDDPLAIIRSLMDALRGGAAPKLLARRVAYAAALRLARFATSNEVTDWFNPQHTFIHANAVHQAILRSPTPDVVRAILQAAIAVYTDRFLNVPPARLPGLGGELDKLPESAKELQESLLTHLNRRGEIETTARLVARYVRLGHPLAKLVDTLTFATVREDLDFHSLQVLEAGARQARAWNGGPEAEHILVGVMRNLAAHCPTRRAGQQTASIALRLHRGDKMYEGQAETSRNGKPEPGDGP